MDDKNLSALFLDDAREWFCEKEVRDYINWCRGFCYTFPDLHMNDQTISYDSSIYTFKEVDFPKEKIKVKILYHFYSLCNIIFKKLEMLYQSLLLIFFTTNN